MLLPMLLKTCCKPTLSCRRSQETLQFLPSSLFQALPLTATATATTSITQLKQRQRQSIKEQELQVVPTDIVFIILFPKPDENYIF